MKLDKNIKTCLVISYGPVPTPQYQTIEGGGMRAWGLAKGLQANGISATVAINNSFPQEHTNHDGVNLINWGLDDAFANTINSFDAVLVSYNMGDASVFIADRINDNVQLILDAYVPIYVEVSAREAKDMESEMKNYLSDMARFNHSLKRGDYFLCASETQKVFYTGVLSALGVINPRSYREDRIQIAPFGIHEDKAVAATNPYIELGIAQTDFVVLWFGGLYPWFRVEELLGAIDILSSEKKIKFVFVGGKNPFNPNPDFARQYDKAVDFAKSHKLTNKSVYFVDWVDYGTRVDWYKGADVVISLNQPGEENGLSWRTRVMDFVWGELAMITNGGDPLSEDLLAHDAAIKLPELTATAIANSIKKTYDEPSILKTVKRKVVALQKKYQWPYIMEPIAKIIQDTTLPYANEQAFIEKLGMEQSTPQAATGPVVHGKLRKAVRLSRKAIGYARRKGLRRSIKVALSIGATVIKSSTISTNKKYVFLSHPINYTGAPLVLMDIVKEYAEKHGASNIKLVAPGALPDQRKSLKKLGISIDKAALGIGFRVIRYQLSLRRDDFVLMNTAAIYPNYLNFIFHCLRNNKLEHAYWFIHEDIDQLPVVCQEIVLNKHLLNEVKDLIKNNKLTVIVPSARVKNDYDEFFETTKIKVVPLKVSVPEQLTHTRKPEDFNEINFLLSGTAADGRKGQLIAISAFYDFVKTYQEANPEKYRPFKLHLVAIGDDYLSQQIKSIGESSLGDAVKIYPAVPKDEAMAITAECNAVVCCSLNETFGLYVAEGMAMGHVVLRNDSAGMEEQLQEGVNGYKIDHRDIRDFSAAIEKVLNKSTISNEKLQKMGAASQKIIKTYTDNTYSSEIESQK
jgi:glycosyltransferase involved in cell wall biosynthesis